MFIIRRCKLKYLRMKSCVKSVCVTEQGVSEHMKPWPMWKQASTLY